MFKHDPHASKTYGKEESKSVKRVSQETFDEVVRENMEEFDMDAAEAVSDAAEQFKLEGVDLSNIEQRAPNADGSTEAPAHPLLVAFTQFRDSVIPRLAPEEEDEGDEEGEEEEQKGIASATNKEALAEASETLEKMAAVLAEDEASRAMASTNGVVTLIVRELERLAETKEALTAALAALRFACTKSDENREHFAKFGEGPGNVSALVTRFLDQPRVLEKAFFAIAQTAKRHEGNKIAYVRAGMLGALAHTMETHKEDAGAVRGASAAIVALCTGDDFRQPTSKAVDHARFLTDPDSMDAVPKLSTAATALKGDAAACTALALAVKSLAVRDDTCDLFYEHGLLDWAVGMLAQHGTEGGSAAAARAACGALATLARNDRNKCAICEGEALPAVVAAMRKHADSAPVADQALAVLGTVCLRHPMNVELVLDYNGAHFVVDAMKRHSASAAVQKQGCLALRNMGVRNLDLRPRILEQDAEAAIRAAREAHPKQCHDLAFAALRDLGLDYSDT